MKTHTILSLVTAVALGAVAQGLFAVGSTPEISALEAVIADGSLKTPIGAKPDAKDDSSAAILYYLSRSVAGKLGDADVAVNDSATETRRVMLNWRWYVLPPKGWIAISKDRNSGSMNVMLNRQHYQAAWCDEFLVWVKDGVFTMRNLNLDRGVVVDAVIDPTVPRKAGETSEFRITVKDREGNLMTNGTVVAEADNCGKVKILENSKHNLANGNPFTVSAKMDEPGFLRMKAKLEAAGNEASATVPYQPYDIKPGTKMPEYFDAIWDDDIRHAERDVPLDPQCEEIKNGHYRGELREYKLSFATTNGKRVYGYMAVPNAASASNKMGVVVTICGAGPGATYAWDARNDSISLMFNIVDYLPTDENAGKDYGAMNAREGKKFGTASYSQSGWAAGRTDVFFHSQIIGIVRALKWAAERPEVDKSDIVYFGGSQGGGCGYAVVGLSDNLFRKAFFYITAMSDLLRADIGGIDNWPSVRSIKHNDVQLKSIEANAPFFDACNFAHRIQCPVRTTLGLEDRTCAPPNVMASFNQLGSRDKRVAFEPRTPHSIRAETFATIYEWLRRKSDAPDWENPAINSRNRLPARTYSMPLKSEQDALTDALEPLTPYKKSLNGNWKIRWFGNDKLSTVNCYWGLDDSDWETIDVPSCVEMRGFGTPGYSNVTYPHANRWPQILDRVSGKADYNPLSIYSRRFKIPADWGDRDVILRFDGVYSSYNVFLNGRHVGYAEDSKLPSEFDITPYLVDGEQQLTVEVRRWCDGSYLEDQDMFRFSGIYRDVTLWALPKGGIWDFVVKTKIAADYASATLKVEGSDFDSVKLYDADNKLVGEAKGEGEIKVADVSLWSAEKPYLYTVVIRKGNDIRSKRIGFKEQKIVGNTVFVNGKAIKFKGVNRHEASPDNGRAVSRAEMVTDIMLFKRYNINTVRTSHYPNHHMWYELCDRYGIYVVAEANVEGHEPGYGKDSLGKYPAWNHTIVERNQRNVIFQRNNPSVTFWSMGNETGHGDCFRNAIAAARKLDPTRLIHWERGNPDADVDSSMYPSVEWLEARGKYGENDEESARIVRWNESKEKYEKNDSYHTMGKAYFLCEYAHAMGNAMGNFAEYWEVFYKYPALSGGCIWDWVDQAIWKYGDRVDPKTGKRERHLAYGGDHDEYPNSGAFCCNGVVGPLRAVSAKLIEVGHVYRNLVVSGKDGGFELWNRFGFTWADEFDGTWELVENGKIVKAGKFEVPHLAPLTKGMLKLPEITPSAGAEVFLNVNFATRKAAPGVPAGWVVARNQIKLGKTGWNFAAAAAKSDANAAVEGNARELKVKVGGTEAAFCRKTGTLYRLALNGVEVLRKPVEGIAGGPQLTCMRAGVDNDRWLRCVDNGWGMYTSGLTQLRYHVMSLKCEGNRVTSVVKITGRKSAGFMHTAVYTFNADGSIAVENKVEPFGTMPPALYRLGLTLRLDAALDSVSYYGKGPRENYVDRASGSLFGLWNSTVDGLAEQYVRPQDNGYRSQVRWVAFTDKDGKGVRFTATEPLFVQAMRYGWEDLEFAHQRIDERNYAPPVPRDDLTVNLDIRQLGLGGASCGPMPMAKYIFPIKTEAWTLRIEPFVKR